MTDETKMGLLDSTFLAQLAEDIGTDGVAEALQLFREDAPGRITAIRRCQAAGQPLDLRREVHALAGAARNVGMTSLGQTAYALQTSIEANRLRNADIDAVVNLAEASLEEAARFEQALLALISAEPGPVRTPRCPIRSAARMASIS